MSRDGPGDTAAGRAFSRLGLTHLKFYRDLSGKLSAEIGARGLPTTLILAPDGAPVAYREGSADWDSDEMVAYLLRVCYPRSGVALKWSEGAWSAVLAFIHVAARRPACQTMILIYSTPTGMRSRFATEIQQSVAQDGEMAGNPLENMVSAMGLEPHKPYSD